jgi:hypothetical protein
MVGLALLVNFAHSGIKLQVSSLTFLKFTFRKLNNTKHENAVDSSAKLQNLLFSFQGAVFNILDV